MKLLEKVFGSRTDTTTVFAAIDDEWRYVPDIVERAGYTDVTFIYPELLRLEQEGSVESRWDWVEPEWAEHRRRVYRRSEDRSLRHPGLGR